MDGRIQVVASGHTADAKADQFKQIENMMKIPGIGAYVLVSNRLDQKNEGEEVFMKNAQEIFEKFPEIDFGIYECPMPWKRLVSLDFLRQVAPQGRMVFLKDTCCDYELIRERLKAVEGTPLKIFNANAQSWFDSYCHAPPATTASWPTSIPTCTSGPMTTRTPILRRPAWWPTS
mgnify:CR=1 FL=1